MMTLEADCTLVSIQKPEAVEPLALAALSDKDLLDEVIKRALAENTFKQELIGEVLPVVDTDVLVKSIKERAVDLVRDTRVTRLVHELRRKAFNTDDTLYYGETKMDDHPHMGDCVGAIITTNPKRGKKRKILATYKPRTYDDVDEEVET